MAYLENDPNKQQGQVNDPNAGGITQAPGVSNVGGIISAGGGAPNAQPGSGGTFQQANLQDYLSANAGQSKTAENLKNEAEGQFTQIQNDLTQKSTDTKNKAQEQVTQAQLSPVDAARAVQDMQAQYAKQYSVQQPASGPQAVGTKTPGAVSGADGRGYADAVAYQPTQSYDDAKSLIFKSLNAQYAGPNDFTYAFDSNTQNLGNGLNDDKQFTNVLNALYQKQNRGQGLSTGQLALQNQLDTSDPALLAQREALKNQYSGLVNQRDSTVSDTNAAIEKARGDLTSQEQALRDSLLSKGNEAKAALNSEVLNRNSGLKDSVNQNLGFLSQEALQNSPNTNYVGGTPKSWLDVLSPEKAAQKLYGDPLTGSGWYSAENIDGADDQRSQFNSIMDALGMNDRINYSQKTGRSSLDQFVDTYKHFKGTGSEKNAAIESYLKKIGLQMPDVRN